MKNITTTVLFDRRNRCGKNGSGTVEIRITADRKSHYFSTGIRLRRGQWSYDRVVNHPAAGELNERIGLYVQRLTAAVNEFLRYGREPDFEELRRNVSFAGEDRRGDVMDWLREQVGMLDVAEGTMKHYTTLLKRLGEFGGFRTWGDATPDTVYRWDAWLHSLRRRANSVQKATGTPPPLLGDAAVHNYHKCLRYLLSRAEKTGKIASNPYNVLRGEFSHGERERTEYLTEEEMAAVESLRPLGGSQMALARDLFVFQMYTGLSYSDAQAFRIGDYKLVDGRWRSVGERIKTGVPFVSQLLPPAVEVLEKYGMKIPQISNSDYNKCLKAIGAAAGISTPLHSHLARHTFATYMLRSGVQIENLSRMLGHTNIARTQRYAKVLALSVNEDFDRVAGMLAERDRKRKEKEKVKGED